MLQMFLFLAGKSVGQESALKNDCEHVDEIEKQIQQVTKYGTLCWVIIELGRSVVEGGKGWAWKSVLVLGFRQAAGTRPVCVSFWASVSGVY